MTCTSSLLQMQMQLYCTLCSKDTGGQLVVVGLLIVEWRDDRYQWDQASYNRVLVCLCLPLPPPPTSCLAPVRLSIYALLLHLHSSFLPSYFTAPLHFISFSFRLSYSFLYRLYLVDRDGLTKIHYFR